jgi:hypothetical protein
MYRCGLVAGHARGTDFAEAIRNNAPVIWPNSLPEFEFGVNLVVDRHTYQVGLLTMGHMPLLPENAPDIKIDLQALGRTMDVNANDSMYSVLPLHGPVLPLQMQHLPMIDVSNGTSILYPAADLQVYSYTSDISWAAPTDRMVPPQFVRFADNGRFVGAEGIIVMQFAPQNASTSKCMAHHSKIDFEMLLRSYSLSFKPSLKEGSEGRPLTANDLNLSLVGLWVVPNAIVGWGVDYNCYASDVRSGNFQIMQSKLAAYKARRKAMLTTTLFVSMVEQTYDDVYAVYTGILGALFGAFALLVTTLFVYLLAAVKRSFVC